MKVVGVPGVQGSKEFLGIPGIPMKNVHKSSFHAGGEAAPSVDLTGCSSDGNGERRQ
jgi:hypothetical protein